MKILIILLFILNISYGQITTYYTFDVTMEKDSTIIKPYDGISKELELSSSVFKMYKYGGVTEKIVWRFDRKYISVKEALGEFNYEIKCTYQKENIDVSTNKHFMNCNIQKFLITKNRLIVVINFQTKIDMEHHKAICLLKKNKKYYYSSDYKASSFLIISEVLKRRKNKKILQLTKS